MAGIADMSNQQLLDGYYKLSNPQALKDYYLKTLRDRANHGSSDAKRIVGQIEQSLISR